jgi:hypothetical protein
MRAVTMDDDCRVLVGACSLVIRGLFNCSDMGRDDDCGDDDCGDDDCGVLVGACSLVIRGLFNCSDVGFGVLAVLIPPQSSSIYLLSEKYRIMLDLCGKFNHSFWIT